MNITQEKINELNTLVKINIEPADYTEKVNNAIKTQSKKARLPGFRPGKVPTAHIKKLYGKSILVEEINTLLSDKLSNYIDENNLNILGQPLPKADEDAKYNWDFNDTFDFSYELGLAPEVKVELSDKDKFTHYTIKADKETIDERVKNLRRGYGKMSNPEVSEEGDVLYSQFQQLTPDGEIFEGGIDATASLRLEMVEDKKILKSLLGRKKGDELTIDLHKAFKDDAGHKISHLLEIDQQLAEDLKSEFKLTVQNVNRLEEADLNEEFFTKVFPDGSVKTEAEMRDKVAAEIEDIMGENADKKLQLDIYEQLLKKAKIDLPDPFLKRWLKSANENVSEEQIEEEYDAFARNLRITLVENSITKENNIEIKPDEVVDLAKKRIEAQFKMYSPTALTEEQLSEYAVNFLQDRERANQLYEEVRSQKVFEHLKSVVKLQDKEIGYKAFIDLK